MPECPQGPQDAVEVEESQEPQAQPASSAAAGHEDRMSVHYQETFHRNQIAAARLKQEEEEMMQEELQSGNKSQCPNSTKGSHY